jgi:nicotinate-nucleotide pyrophosphorylase (carboxylating)
MPAGSVAQPPIPALDVPPDPGLVGPDPAAVAAVVAAGLHEDVGAGDVTTDALVDPLLRSSAELLLKGPGVLAGLDIAAAVFRALDPAVTFRGLIADGERYEAADLPVTLVAIEGTTSALLTGERLALNVLGRLSGIATLTRRYVEAVEGTGAVILDTRKTTPGLRALEKYAVRCGGGTNHRIGLFDAVLIKDNHLRAAGGVRRAIEAARRARPDLAIEVETETLGQVREALDAGADRILLDNMPLPLLREAVAVVHGRVPLEASGGVSLATVRGIAETGVDCISVGALTHSAVALDVSLEFAA